MVPFQPMIRTSSNYFDQILQNQNYDGGIFMSREFCTSFRRCNQEFSNTFDSEEHKNMKIRVFSHDPDYLEFSADKIISLGEILKIIEQKIGPVDEYGLYSYEKRLDLNEHDLNSCFFDQIVDSFDFVNLYLGTPHLLEIFKSVQNYKEEPRNYENRCIEFDTSEFSDSDYKFIHIIKNYFCLKIRRGPESVRLMAERFGEIPVGLTEVIDDFLFLGSVTDAKDIESLKKNKIRRVLDLSNWKPFDYDEYNIIEEHKRIEIEDTSDVKIFDMFESVNKWIDDGLENGVIVKPTLIHCVVGKSRSASFVIAYLMKSQNMDLKTAFLTVLKKRHLVGPNEGFLEELRKYEIFLFGPETPVSLKKEDFPSR